MNLRTILLATSMCLTAVSFAGVAHAAICDQDSPHVYGAFAGAFVTVDGGATGGANTFVVDRDAATTNCDGYATPGDGDAEQGVNGGRFPSTEDGAGCLGTVGQTFPGDIWGEGNGGTDPDGDGTDGNPTGIPEVDAYFDPVEDSIFDPYEGSIPQYLVGHPSVGHHSTAAGVTVDITDSYTPTGVQGTIGTDGPAAALANYVANSGVSFEAGDASDCVGNGVISNDGNTDPGDCGSGDLGITVQTGILGASTAVSGGVPMSYGRNVEVGDVFTAWAPAGSTAASDCASPSDGYGWAFLPAGPLVTTTAPGDGGYLFTAEGDGGAHQYCGTTKDVESSIPGNPLGVDDTDTNTMYGPENDVAGTNIDLAPYPACIVNWLTDNTPAGTPSVTASLPTIGSFPGY